MNDIKYYSAAALGCALWIQFSLARPAIAVGMLAVFFALLGSLVLVWSGLMLYCKLPERPMLEQQPIEIVEAPQPVQLPNIIIQREQQTPIDLTAFQPSKNSILLGQNENQLITSSVSRLCHVAIVGSTGRGKTNVMRTLIPQLQAVGARIVLADPHYTSFDPDSGDDWRPIEQHLYMPPAVSPEEIDQLFLYLETELENRLKLRRDGKPFGKPLFLAYDELPIISRNKNAINRLARILQEGRKVHLLTIGASQSMLVRDIGTSSAVREQFQTAIYVGGDRKSAAAILDIPERQIDDSQLGKGTVLLKSADYTGLANVPLCTNQAIESLLKPLQECARNQTETNRSFGFSPPTAKPEKAVSNEISGLKPETQNPEVAQILQLFKQGENVSDIVKRMYQVHTGPKYNQKRDYVESILRSSL